MFTNPQKSAENFGLMPGMQVADLGAGSGAYCYVAARLVTEAGKVYAVDIQKDVLSSIKNEADRLHLHNIEVIWGDVEKVGGTKLSNDSLDFVIASNILFQVEDKKAFLSEVKRILKPGKRVVVIDWRDSFGGLGPDPKSVIQGETCRNLFLDFGFSVDREMTDVGEHHYGIIFKKNN